MHYVTASNVKREKKNPTTKKAWLYIRTSPQLFKMWVSLCNIAGPLSENRSQVGLSSTTHARFRRKTYQKKMCCVPFLFCHFPKAWSPYNADNHSHDTVLKIAEIQPQVVNTQSGEHSPKIVILLNRMNFVLCSQESLAADGCLDLHTAEFRSIRKKIWKELDSPPLFQKQKHKTSWQHTY